MNSALNRIIRADWQRGMSLIELMVAITIFALVLVGIVPIMMLAIGYNREAKRMINARTVMNNLSETLKTMRLSDPWRQDDGDPNDLGNNPLVPADPPADHSIVDPVNQFTINWNIRQTTPTQQDIRIFVNWQDRRGANRFLSTDITVVGD